MTNKIEINVLHAKILTTKIEFNNRTEFYYKESIIVYRDATLRLYVFSPFCKVNDFMFSFENLLDSLID